MKWVCFFLCLFFFSSHLLAKTEHKLIRRVVVFPIQVDEVHLRDVVEDSWWALQQELIKNKMFLVASRSFLRNKDVFQARKELTPADAIILGQFLDTHALVTTWVKGHQLIMNVYEGRFGRNLWSHTLHMNPSISIKDQLKEAVQRGVQNFIASVPYQGFVVPDTISQKVVRQVNGDSLVRVDFGLSSQIDLGVRVYFVKIYSHQLKSLLQKDLQIETFAEGEVVEKEGRIAIVKVVKEQDGEASPIVEGSLVRIPRELNQFQNFRQAQSEGAKDINHTYLVQNTQALNEEQREQKEVKPLVNSVAFIFNVLAFILLAF